MFGRLFYSLLHKSTKYFIYIILCLILLIAITFLPHKNDKSSIRVSNVNILTSPLPKVNFNQIFVKNESLEECRWKFDHYVGSVWEMSWYNNIDVLQDKVCETLLEPEQMNKSIRMLEYTITLQQLLFSGSSISNGNELFSRMFYRMVCPSGRSILVAQEIEPLIGLLRDPLTICPEFNKIMPMKFIQRAEDAMQSKRFLLLAPSSPYFNINLTVPIAPWIYQNKGQKILFDIGSSYFNGGEDTDKVASAIGARWFYEYFRKISLRFDRIFAFEQGVLPPKTAWTQIPDDLLSVYTFINVPVEANGKFNPLTILQSFAKPQDYVIVKLDIDAFNLERSFIEQIIENKVLHTLIDEMFFEMHVFVKEMAPFWQDTTGPYTLNETYVLFSKLRQLGIRMHSWP